MILGRKARYENVSNNTKFFSWRRVMHGVTIGIIGAVVIFIAVYIPLLDPIQRAFSSFSMTDIYYEIIRDDTYDIDPDIVIVDITDLHNRADIAEVINQLNIVKPKVLAVDLLFEGYGDINEDAALVDAVGSSDNIVMATKLMEYDEDCGVFKNILMPFFADDNSGDFGYSNVPQIVPGSPVRNYTISQQYNKSTVFSLPYLTACMAKGVKPQKHEENETSIIFTNTAFRKIDHKDIAANAKYLTNKIVLLGTYSAEEDSHITPIGKIPGVEINAFAIQTILSNRRIVDSGLLVSLLLCFIACYISAWIDDLKESKGMSLLGKILIMILNGPITVILIVWLSYWLYVQYDYDIHPLYALFGVLLSSDAHEVQQHIIELFKGKNEISTH